MEYIKGFKVMNDRTFRVLEFHKIVDQLRTHAETSMGNELVAKIKPAITIDEVKHKQLETDEAAQIIRLNKVIPLGGIFDIRESLKRAYIGGVLNESECLDIATTIYGGRQVKNFVDKLEEELPLIESLTERITPLKDLEQQIKMCIDEHGHVMDNASQKLRGIRSAIRTFESRVRERLDHFTKTRSNLLSDAIVTIRNDRYVLPVKHEHRGSVGGIVHDQSASGQTLFMEPKAVIELNNQLQEAKSNEQQEINRILRELSEKIAEQQAYLHENVIALAEIDFIYARAKLAREMGAAMPKMNDQGIIKMKQARHPLIPADEVVANDIELGESFTTILVTGPNTGGKTVMLKMVGLCVLMAQSGLQIPALDGCEIAMFEKIFADIGDEQSIEQNLSTFSSHMTNIVQIMEEVDDRSLVLFDELGAGTDPQEGASLAMSILDEVISRDARVIATTHYPELKAFGYNRKNVINASVEFDVQTLQPTYRLLIGIPGRSNAFEISKRLGLDEQIINDAKGHIGVDSKSVENMISSLEDARKKAELEYEEAHQLLEESEKLRTEIEEEWRNFDRNREQLYKKAEEKAEKSIQAARAEAEMIIEEIRNMKTAATFKEHEWIEARKMLEDAQPHLSRKQEDQGSTIDQKQDRKELQSGDEVKVLSLNQKGTILEKISDDEYMVQIGIMKVNIKRNNLQVIQAKKKATTPVTMVKRSGAHVSTELDLRGERYADALLAFEKYIDDSLLAGHQKVRIIHGKGTGALRKGIQDFAKGHPNIASFKFAPQNEGGTGATIIEFK